MIKQTLVSDLTALFGQNKGARFQSWVQRWVEEQLKRGVTTHDDWVFVEEVGLDRLYASMREVVEGLQDVDSRLFDDLFVVPCYPSCSVNLGLIPEFKSSFFVEELRECGIEVAEFGQIKEDDLISQTSSFEHIFVDPDSGAKGEVVAMYVNVVGKDGTKGSLVMSMDELNHIKHGQMTYKYGGVDPLSDSEWANFFEACLLRRFVSGSIFDALRNNETKAFSRLWFAVKLHNEQFSLGAKHVGQKENMYKDGYDRFKTRRIFSDPSNKVSQHSIRDESKKVEHIEAGAKVVHIEEKRSQLRPAPIASETVYADQVASSSVSQNNSYIESKSDDYVDSESDGVLENASSAALFDGSQSVF